MNVRKKNKKKKNCGERIIYSNENVHHLDLSKLFRFILTRNMNAKLINNENPKLLHNSERYYCLMKKMQSEKERMETE